MAVEATEARRGEKGTGALSAGETREGGAAPADRDAWGRVAVSGEDAEKLRGAHHGRPTARVDPAFRNGFSEGRFTEGGGGKQILEAPSWGRDVQETRARELR